VSLEAAMLCKELIVTSQDTVAREVKESLSIRANAPDYSLIENMDHLFDSTAGFSSNDSLSEYKNIMKSEPNFIPDSMYNNVPESRNSKEVKQKQEKIKQAKAKYEEELQKKKEKEESRKHCDESERLLSKKTGVFTGSAYIDDLKTKFNTPCEFDDFEP